MKDEGFKIDHHKLVEMCDQSVEEFLPDRIDSIIKVRSEMS